MDGGVGINLSQRQDILLSYNIILIGTGELFRAPTISGRKELPFNSNLYAK